MSEPMSDDRIARLREYYSGSDCLHNPSCIAVNECLDEIERLRIRFQEEVRHSNEMLDGLRGDYETATKRIAELEGQLADARDSLQGQVGSVSAIDDIGVGIESLIAQRDSYKFQLATNTREVLEKAIRLVCPLCFKLEVNPVIKIGDHWHHRPDFMCLATALRRELEKMNNVQVDSQPIQKTKL